MVFMLEPDMTHRRTMRRKPSLSAEQIRQARDDGPVGRYIGSQIRLTHIAALDALEAEIAPLKSSPIRFALLDQVNELPGSTQGTLADILDVDRTTLVPMLASMERQGLVKRTPSQDDKRSVRVDITAKGRKLLHKLKPIAAAHEARLCRGMSQSEQAAFAAALRKIRRNLTEP